MRNSIIWLITWFLCNLLILYIAIYSYRDVNKPMDTICGTILAKLSDSDIVIQTSRGKEIITLTDETYKKAKLNKYICVNKTEE